MEEAGHQEKLDHLLGALDRDWERLNAAQDDWIERLGNTRGLLRSLAGALEKHKAESAEAQASTREELAALREALAAGGGASVELEARIAELESGLATANEANASHLARIAELESTLTERDAALATAEAAGETAQSMQQELAELREAERALKTELASLRPQAEQAVASSQQAIEQLAALSADLESQRAVAATLCNERDALAADLAQLQSQGAGTAESLAAAAARAEAAEARANTGERELAEALEQVASAERELIAARQNHEQALAAQEELGEQVAQLQKQLDNERDRVRSFEAQVDDEKSKGTKATLAAQLAEALQEAEDARNEVQELKRALQQASRAPEPDASAPKSPARRSAEEELNLVRQAAEAKGGGKFTIGELLINAGLVTQAQVEQAIEEQKQDRHQHIGAILVRNGWASEDAVAQALAYQCNVEFVRLADLNMNAESTALISERIANQHGCVPIDADDGSITLAMVNPLNLVAIEDIERITSRKVEVVVGAPREIQEAISKFYWEPE
jgi:chromosome segregation ATPase